MFWSIPSIMTSSYGKASGTYPDVSTASYDSVSLDVSAHGAGPTTFFIKPDGSKLYVASNTDRKIYQYSITSGDLSTASYDSKSYDLTVFGITPAGIYITDDGLNLFMFDYDAFFIKIAFSSAWDISTVATSPYPPFYVESEMTTGANGYFLDSLGKCYSGSIDHNSVFQYNFGTPGDISTVSYSGNSFSFSSEITSNNVIGVFCTTDGKYLYASCYGSPYYIFQYIMSTPGDLSTCSYTGKSFYFETQLDFSGQVFFYGTKMYICDYVNSKIFQYTVSLI